MFSYCENNPVNRSDPTGELPIFVVGALVGIGEQFVCDVLTNIVKGNPLDTFSSVGTYVSAAINGAFATLPSGKITTVIARQIIAETAGLSIDAAVSPNRISTSRVMKDVTPDIVSNTLANNENKIVKNLGANYKGNSQAVTSIIKDAKKATRTVIRNSSQIIRILFSLV